MTVNSLEMKNEIIQMVFQISRTVVRKIVFLGLQTKFRAFHGVKVVLELFLQMLTQWIIVQTVLLDG